MSVPLPSPKPKSAAEAEVKKPDSLICVDDDTVPVGNVSNVKYEPVITSILDNLVSIELVKVLIEDIVESLDSV